ncbi:MAG: isoprenylcysteine carboxylmethyltransferase family protein [Anaerolineaceae bacterium]|nr:isoprenylcysteine carboxylmethyltransferase family protein [Anaerolineaceae bacterium]
MIKTMLLWIVKALFSKAIFAFILFLSAGTMKWIMAWLFIAIFLLFDIATAIVVAPRHPDLLDERTKLGQNVKSWDKILLRIVAAYGPFTVWIISGWQFRFGWQPEIPFIWQWTAAGFTALGFAIVTWSMAANAFFTTTGRLQPERGQTVASSGPYHHIRHPGYLGAILFNLATPVMLGSSWGFIPAVLVAAGYILRTYLEDQTLQAELSGYEEYTRKTRYRLFPYVW